MQTVRELEACTLCTGSGVEIAVAMPFEAVQMTPIGDVVSQPPSNAIAGVLPEIAT